jgi:hypothetical protein
MKTISLVLILGFYTIGAAQSSDLIQGKWVLEKH